MHPLVLVLVLLTASVTILACVALCRGWLRLAPVPVHNKFQFVLMRKKNTLQDDDKKAQSDAQDPR